LSVYYYYYYYNNQHENFGQRLDYENLFSGTWPVANMVQTRAMLRYNKFKVADVRHFKNRVVAISQ